MLNVGCRTLTAGCCLGPGIGCRSTAASFFTFCSSQKVEHKNFNWLRGQQRCWHFINTAKGATWARAKVGGGPMDSGRTLKCPMAPAPYLFPFASYISIQAQRHAVQHFLIGKYGRIQMKGVGGVSCALTFIAGGKRFTMPNF